jgi:hypothetical protein
MAFFPHHASITPPDMGVAHAILRGSMEGAGYRGCPLPTGPCICCSRTIQCLRGRVSPRLTTPGLVVSPFGQAHFLPGPPLLDHQLEAICHSKSMPRTSTETTVQHAFLCRMEFSSERPDLTGYNYNG